MKNKIKFRLFSYLVRFSGPNAVIIIPSSPCLCWFLFTLHNLVVSHGPFMKTHKECAAFIYQCLEATTQSKRRKMEGCTQLMFFSSFCKFFYFGWIFCRDRHQSEIHLQSIHSSYPQAWIAMQLSSSHYLKIVSVLENCMLINNLTFNLIYCGRIWSHQQW